MRVALKITMWVMVLVSIVVVLEVALSVEGEQRLLEEDSRERHRAVGGMLVASVEHIWKHEGEGLAREMLATQHGDSLSWRLQRLSPGRIPDALRGRTEIVGRLLRGDRVLWVREVAPGTTQDTWVSRWPLRVPSTNGDTWLLECAESLKTQRARLRQELRRATLIASIALVLSSVFSLLLGYVLVGRPVRGLLVRFEQVKKGDLERRETPPRRDELGDLERSFEVMVVHLAQAQQDLDSEQIARQHITEQLRQADRLRSVGTLAAGVAHELGTPLHVIDGRANMILGATSSPERVERHARIITEQCERMQTIVRRLMDLSRSDVLHRERILLEETCAHVLELLRPKATERQVELTLDSHGEHALTGERVLLEQALLNIIENAIAACEPGAQVRVGVVEGEHEIGVFVEDEGRGMNEEELAQACDPFYTTKDIGEGTGLGLSITYGIVSEHGGHLEIESAREGTHQGTRVVMWFETQERES